MFGIALPLQRHCTDPPWLPVNALFPAVRGFSARVAHVIYRVSLPIFAVLGVFLGAETTAFAGDPPWAGKVRVEGVDATGTAFGWDPALSEAGPAEDRVLAWDAAKNLKTRAGAWYQYIPGLRVLRPRRTLEPSTLAADAEAVQAFFRDRGYPEATVTPELREGRHKNVRDVAFVVVPGPFREATEEPQRESPPESGWQVKPIGTILGRGTAFSAYAGAHAVWRAPQVIPTEIPPTTLVLHGEVGVRAFGDPGAKPAFDGDVGVWSDLYVDLSTGIAPHVSVFGALRGRSDSWPGMSEAEPSVASGLRWSGAGAVSAEAAVEVGHWRSWAQESQRDRYDPWFGGTPYSEDQRQFAPAYTYGRLDLSVVADTTDRRINPRSGVRVAATGTPIAIAEGKPFVRANLDARGFVPVIGRRVIVAFRGKAGALGWHDPDQRSLFGERFFLGPSEMRSWGSRQVTVPEYPGEKGDLRVGGDFLTYANAEVRWDVHRDLSLGAFLDTGRVWEHLSDIQADNLLWDVGVSGTAPSPLGAVRVDVAWRLTDQPTDTPFPIAIQIWLDQPW